MSRVDWSKAPEGATHWGPENADYVEAFYRQDGDRWFFAAHHTGWRWNTFMVQDAPNGDRLKMLVERPVSWNGEGLPPVGTVCEVHNAGLRNPEWERCTILFMGAFKCVYESDSCHERVADVSDDYCITSFRPLRTPEQIAAEEREKAIDAMQEAVSKDPQYGRKVCAALYDAGYRKVTP